MYAPKKVLRTEIELLRNKMTEIACDRGFTSEESIIVSQELDKLINVYQGLNKKNRKKDDLEVLYEYSPKIIT